MFSAGGVSARMAHVSMKIHSFEIMPCIYIYMSSCWYFPARHEVASQAYELAGTCPRDMKLLSYTGVYRTPCLKIHTQSLNTFEPNIAY